MKAKLVRIPPQTVDDFGDLAKLREEFAPTELLYKKLRAELNALCAGAAPEDEFVVKGERYTLRISACQMNREVDVPAARKKLGWEKFLACCTVTLAAISNYLTKPECDALTIESMTGPRRYLTVPIAAARSQADPLPPDVRERIDRLTAA
jgi:hypothetical protein